MPTEPKTKREILVELVLARLRTITTTNGFRTNAGGNVDYWRTGSYSEEEMADKTDAALILRDIDELKTVEGDPTKVNKVPTEKFLRHLHMQIEIALTGSQSPSEIHKVIADIEMAIRKDVRWHTGGKAVAVGTRPRLDRSVVEQNSLKTSGIVYEFFITYITDAFNPYQ